MKKKFNFYYKMITIPLLVILAGCGTTSNTSDSNSDSNPPTITLHGDNKPFIRLGNTYDDPGVSAIDDVDGDITSKVVTSSNIDYSKAGTYTITYSISDNGGNTSSIKRSIDIYDMIDTLNPRSGITINEIMASNASTNLDPDYKSFSDWIELYNNQNSTVNIGGYYLSDNKSQPKKWTIPSGTTLAAHSYLLIWTDKEDTGLHTNFSLNSDGETITLYDRSGTEIVDSITFGEQKSDISCAKMNDTLYFMNPTPGFSNTKDAITPSKRSKKPAFTKESGFYTNTLSVELTQINNADIYYTIDGATPTKSSLKYSSAIALNKTTVVRARSYDGSFLPSKINTHTYLINEDTTLPVVSIAIDNTYLYDDKIGIYTLGTDSNGNIHDSDPSKFRIANYGQDWERPASFEYFIDKKAVISDNVGIKIHGRYSRALAQKSFNIYARGKYDDKYINYPLFPNKPQVEKVKSFTLRNSGGDWGHTMLRDAMTQSLIKDTMSLDYQDYQAAILFINGKYWGIQNIRERSNGELIRSNHDIKTKNMDLLAKTVDRQEIYEGDNNHYAAMIAYIETNGVNDTNHYNYIRTQMDIDNYTNYMITEMFIGSNDWPLNNNKYWRERTKEGKWRWILYDTDSGFWSYKVGDDPFDYLLNTASYSAGQKNTLPATFLFRSLMSNSSFKTQFLSKFTEHLSTTFASTRVVNIIENHEKNIEGEIERHIDKWSSSYDVDDKRSATTAEWHRQIDNLKSFARDRTELIKSLLSQQ